MEFYFNGSNEDDLAKLLIEKDEKAFGKTSGRIYLDLCYNDYDLKKIAEKALSQGEKNILIYNLRMIIAYMHGYLVKTPSFDSVFPIAFEEFTGHSFYGKKFTLDGIKESPYGLMETALGKIRAIHMHSDESGYGHWANFKDMKKPGYIAKGMCPKMDSKIKALINHLNFPEWQLRLFERYGANIKDNSLILAPIKKEALPKKLAHFGIEKRPIDCSFNNLVFDNKKNIEKLGIWGNCSPETPTYLMKEDKNPSIIRCAASSKDFFFKLTVDSEKLSEYRNIFIDPESLMNYEEEFSNCFIVLGGIPKESIISIDEFKL